LGGGAEAGKWVPGWVDSSFGAGIADGPLARVRSSSSCALALQN